MPETVPNVAAVVIGRNEGERLRRCLVSLARESVSVVYVDSGSTDGSVAVARALGADVVELDMDRPFTAARARNAGFDALTDRSDAPGFVQFVDGDCEVLPGWIDTARRYLLEHPKVAAVAGRLREKHPEASVFNRLADAEWDRPAGRTDAIGGIAMMRVSALNEVGGFDPALVAGEEPELCLRLRRAGWDIWQLGADMALHDIGMTRFSQWWRRSRRAGHAYAEGAAMHGAAGERYNVREVRRILLWGGAIPAVALLGGAFLSPWALLILLAYPAQVLRLRLRGEDWLRAVFLMLGKFPEVQGVAGYYISRVGPWRGVSMAYEK